MEVRGITDLHEYILLSIFCFLPAKFIIRCRCVCKQWANLICQPYFPYEYFSRGKAPLQFVLERDNNLVLAQLDEALLTSDDVSIPAHLIFDLGIPQILGLHKSVLQIVTCQVTGWILVVIFPWSEPRKKHDYHMYNPITGQHIVVKKSKRDKATWSVRCALVLARKSNQLKFLKFYKGKAHIQTIGTDSWRSLGKVYRCDGPILLNGHCHWLHYLARVIISFDAEEEVFKVIHMLSCFHDYRLGDLGVLEVCLCIGLLSYNYVFELWVMNEYGIQDSWTKKFVILEPVLFPRYLRKLLEPLACLKSGEILLFANRKTVISKDEKTESTMLAYNPHSSKYKYVEFR